MPATEQTWRNLKTLHVVFGASALALLLTTVWMLAADHDREAKALQQEFAVIEARHLQWRKSEELTGDFQKRRQVLSDALTTARSNMPPQAATALDGFVATAEAAAAKNAYDLDAVRKARQQWAESEKQLKPPERRIADRDRVVAAMQRVIDKAVFVENEAQRKLKFEKAELDVDISMLAIEIDEGKPPQTVDARQKKIADLQKKIDQLTADYQTAKTHRLALQEHFSKLRADEVAAQKELDKHDAGIKQIDTAILEKSPNFGKWFLELPILDAFGGPLKPQQVWLPELPWNNNFRNVARFDRCVTCHQGIDKTAAGSAVAPAYEHAHDVTAELETPKTAPAVEDNYERNERGELVEKPLNDRLRQIYGLLLADEGLLDPNHVTVEAVYDQTPAARAGLKAGDVIARIGGVKILDRTTADTYLAKSVAWGKPLSLTIRRGMPHPYASHPRLDLFVGSMSPHKVGDFGCTICHEGQGNGTAFKWVSHTPNDPEQAAAWSREHGWFNNHHWIYPMLPKRFEEANCLKCHHDVTELKPSKRFPDPPAPKLMEGFTTIQDVGCFGCHEINGFDGPTKRRGPDLRVEPNYFAAAAQVLADPKLQGEALDGDLARVAELARQVVDHPERTSTRKLLAELIQDDAKVAADGKSAPVLTATTHAMAGILGADDETPGQYGKVGPSLRYVAAKNDAQFLYNWIKNPADFRPTTKMPKFFGLWDHLNPPKHDAAGHVVFGKDGKPEHEPSPGLADSERFEPIEILAATQYLLKQSRPFRYTTPPKTAADGKAILPPDAERGKIAFQTRGCLACHTHVDFPGIAQTQGPDLSGLGAKLTGDAGRDWLYTWLKQPSRYHARTVMPNLLLDPMTVVVNGPDGKPVSSTTSDPAADITAFLLSKKDVVEQDRKTARPWKGEALPTVKSADVDDLMRLYLSGAFTKSETDRIIKQGIPEAQRAQVKGDEQLLVTDGPLTEEQKLLYLGKRTIGRLGCAGCHDVPGFEDAKPIGTGLADWGRKEPSKLAFEQIMRYLHDRDAEHGTHVGPPDLDKDFFIAAMEHHQREGFLWQKLREPRSYDYMKTENKSYIDRLRMPKFNLTDAQREAIMTFVLGLVAEPPPAKYVYKPNPKQAAILAGTRVIDKYNCAGCHALEMQQWDIDYKPGKLKAPPTGDEYAFLIPHFAPEAIEKSKQVDRRGLGHATLFGLPQPKEDEEEPTVYFKLWAATLIDGQTWLPGGIDVEIDEKLNPPGGANRRPQQGGVLADYLHPVALALEKKANPNVKASDVWGFLPPPLNQEGKKVQTQWLHDFLLNPYLIRPSTILRMPKFHMTSAESQAIVDHFAARDGVEFPYEYDPRREESYLAAEDAAYRATKKAAQAAAKNAPPAAAAAAPAAPAGGQPGAAPLPTVPSGDGGRLDDALGLVTDNGFCIKCHRIGDFSPAGSLSAVAPNLAQVHNRLRPEFLRDWLANPARILPFTGMPVNFPKNQVVGQHRYKGTSEQQLNAIVDLLLNYDDYMKAKTSLKPLIQAAPPAATPTPPAAGGE